MDFDQFLKQEQQESLIDNFKYQIDSIEDNLTKQKLRKDSRKIKQTLEEIHSIHKQERDKI